MIKKIIGIMLAMALCLCSVQIGFAQEDTPTYIIGAEQSDGNITVTISIDKASATVGRFGLAYDTEKVELLDKNGEILTTATPKVSEVVTGDSSVTIPAQTATDGQGVSTTDGFVMFVWYASGSRVNATDAAQAIASINFKLKDGVTEEDFNSTTFRLKTITHGTYPGWWSGAHIATGTYDHFWNNVDGFGQCAVVKNYTNSDVMPIITYMANFTVTDGEGAAVDDAAIRVNETDYITDASGKLTIELPVGDYGYTVSKDAHESKSGTISVLDKDVSEAVAIRTDMQYVTEEVQKVEIVYAEGDSAEAVTSSIGLPFSDIGGAKLSWKSSNANVITDAGAVVRPKVDTEVTVTLTFTKGEASVTKDFVLTVLKKGGTASGTMTPDSSGSMSGNGTLSGDTSDDNTDESDKSEITDDESKDDETTDGSENQTNTPQGTVKETEFADLGQHLWAKEAIITLAKDGVIKGTSETTFAPGAPIKRGDFVTLLVRMFDFQADTADNFADVPQDSYYFREIAIAKALGIARGTDSEHFQPEATISRQDMMVIVHRAMDLYGIPLSETEKNVLDTFADKDSIAPYAADAVAQLVGAKLITGNNNGEINPLGMTTRAEVAVFLYRIYGIV